MDVGKGTTLLAVDGVAGGSVPYDSEARGAVKEEATMTGSGILSAWRRAGRGTGQGWPKLDENCTSSCSDTSSAPVSAAAPSAILARRAPRTPSANRLDNRLKSRLFERTVVVGPQSPLRRIAACHCGTHTICSHAIYKTGLNPVV